MNPETTDKALLQKARLKRYYEKNAERLKQRRRLYYANRRDDPAVVERNRKRARVWRSNNLERAKKHILAWVAANPDRVKQWRKRNMQSILARNRNRRSLQLSARGTHTAEDIAALYKRQRGKCETCKRRLFNKYHVDHITPLVRGGGNGPDNLQLLCPSCNLRKHTKDGYEWAAENGRLF
jgi:5-methylcytosine-specific restriction endonuclease McrA